MKTIKITEEKPKGIDYADVMELGFKRGDMNDNVFFNERGHDDYWVEKRINDRMYLSWEHLTLICSFKVIGKDGCIKESYDIADINTLKQLIEIL